MRVLPFATAAAITPVLLLASSLCCADQPRGATSLVAGNARFEFLTPSLLRLEYAPAGVFVDAPTAVVQQRDWPPVSVERRDQDGWLVAHSATVTVRYRLSSGAFTAQNLEVSWKDPAGTERKWHPGDVDSGNLGGLNYSLDGIGKSNLPASQADTASPVDDSIPGIDLVLPKALPGLLSRSGYAFIDDSATPVQNAQRTWIEPRTGGGGQDWYLFVYGRDFRQVLGAYAQLCGPIPMVPRFVLGPMITDFNFEYFPGSAEAARPESVRYNQQYLMNEVARMRGSHIPFDTLVLDFAWHNYGWDGGYDWSPLFPHPQELMRALHAQGVKLSLNDHPGYINTPESILSFSDSHAPEVLTALGREQPPKPSLDIDLSKQWSFATDAHGPWQPVRVGLPWQEQGHPDYRGPGWYRTTVHLPAQLPKVLYLWLGEVASSYQVFVNGQDATHSQIHWPQRLSSTDLTAFAAPGGELEIVLRVEPDVTPGQEARGGIVLGPTALRDVKPPERIYFDLSNQHQADVSMRDLHGPLMQQGVDVWWVDGGSGAVDMPGLNKQMWTNKVFYDYSQKESGKRAFILGRYGDWGSQRYPGFFTGDTYSQWEVLAYEVAFSARGGNVLVPYISHDIGGFLGKKIDFELYARWIEFGAFSGILRMHSAHENPREGNVRMPWVYGPQGMALMKRYFTLRTQLIPYLYTYTRVAHTQSLPLLRPLYLADPDLEEAYRHSHEYFLGDALLVAPVVTPRDEHTVYLPPGAWRDFFSGKRYPGGGTFTRHYAVEDTPVFVRDGAVIPEQPVSEYSDAQPLDRLILTVYGAGTGDFELYEDDGSSLDYEREQGRTALRHATQADGASRLTIGPTEGSYRGQPQSRSYQVRIYADSRPASVLINGQRATHLSWDAVHGLAVVEVAASPIRAPLDIEWR
jgi:alpha-glucosidase (family GH31 glycosyl hydrolase)